MHSPLSQTPSSGTPMPLVLLLHSSLALPNPKGGGYPTFVGTARMFSSLQCTIIHEFQNAKNLMANLSYSMYVLYVRTVQYGMIDYCPDPYCKIWHNYVINPGLKIPKWYACRRTCTCTEYLLCAFTRHIFPILVWYTCNI